jgi:hypothetical protein
VASVGLAANLGEQDLEQVSIAGNLLLQLIEFK